MRHTARFWCGAVLSAAAFAAFRPPHAAGILAGIAGCLTDPPRFVEPPARREYVLIAEAARAAQQAD
jgi:hypothetical protein